jgi:hypothetical protein
MQSSSLFYGLRPCIVHKVVRSSDARDIENVFANRSQLPVKVF